MSRSSGRKISLIPTSAHISATSSSASDHVLNVHEHFFLIDCGEGTQIQLRKYKIKFSRINHIFISHMHGDHVFGLPGLFSTFNLLGRKNDLYVYGNSQLEHLINFFLQHFGNDLHYKIRFVSVHSKRQVVIYEDKHVVVESLPLKHRIPATGFLFREKEGERSMIKEMIEKYQLSISDIVKIKNGNDHVTPAGLVIPNTHLTIPPYKGRSYAYCSDTMFYQRLAERIKDIDLLYHEATFLDKEKKLARLTMHSTAMQAATIAKEAGAGTLIIGHFSSRYDDTSELLDEARAMFGNTLPAEEGRVYDVPRVRKQKE
ncbi:MAG: ribonuclease Z [Bacteroidales bacterium]